jgi:acyl-CoA reductase-like NAD-dependent aldehyde dehydrogenase
VNEALAAAAAAQRDWRAMAVADRCRLMRAAAGAIRERVLGWRRS